MYELIFQGSWKKLERSERSEFGQFEIDVWPTGDGARYTILDTKTGLYLKGGKCIDVSWAKQVSSNFVQSVLSLHQEEDVMTVNGQDL